MPSLLLLSPRNMIILRSCRWSLCQNRLYCKNSASSSTNFLDSLVSWERIRHPGLYKGLIPLKKMEISCGRSSGPGGQNVNKSNTRVDLRFRVDECDDWIPTQVRERFFADHKQRLSKDNSYFVLRSERTRSQQENFNDCLDRLRAAIRDCQEQLRVEADARPTEQDLERDRRRKEESERRRIQAKRSRSEEKRAKRTDGFF